MERFKIKIDRTQPSSEDIAKTRDFDSVFESYQKVSQPFYQSFKFWGMGFATVAIMATTAVIWYNTSESPAKIATEHEAIVIPFEGNEQTEIADEVMNAGISTAITFKVSEGGTLELPSGGKLVIAPNAFEGLKSDEEVTLKVKSWENPIELLAGSLAFPANQSKICNAMELEAVVDDRPANFLSNKKPELVFSQDADSFQLYGNHQKEEWKSEVKVLKKVELGGLEQKDRSIHTRSSYNLDAKLPPKPQKAINEKLALSLNFNKEDFPELAYYENISFEVDTTRCYFHPSMLEIGWEEFELEKLGAEEFYKMRLTKLDSTLELVVRPVLLGDAFDKALEVYQEQSEQVVESQRKSEPAQKEKWVYEVSTAKVYAFGLPQNASGELIEPPVFKTESGDDLNPVWVHKIDKEGITTYNIQNVATLDWEADIICISTADGRMGWVSGKEAVSRVASQPALLVTLGDSTTVISHISKMMKAKA